MIDKFGELYNDHFTRQEKHSKNTLKHTPQYSYQPILVSNSNSNITGNFRTRL